MLKKKIYMWIFIIIGVLFILFGLYRGGYILKSVDLFGFKFEKNMSTTESVNDSDISKDAFFEDKTTMNFKNIGTAFKLQDSSKLNMKNTDINADNVGTVLDMDKSSEAKFE